MLNLVLKYSHLELLTFGGYFVFSYPCIFDLKRGLFGICDAILADLYLKAVVHRLMTFL